MRSLFWMVFRYLLGTVTPSGQEAPKWVELQVLHAFHPRHTYVEMQMSMNNMNSSKAAVSIAPFNKMFSTPRYRNFKEGRTTLSDKRHTARGHCSSMTDISY